MPAAEARTVEGAPALPLALLAPEDDLTRYRADKLIAEAAASVVAHSVDAPDEIRPNGNYRSLMEAIHCAAEGDEEARRVVETNAKTHIWECISKAGTTFTTLLKQDDDGRLLQHGQLMIDVFKNALLYAAATPEMRERTEAETHNGVLAERLLRLGLLDEYHFVVLSRYPDNMTDGAAEEVGFFPATKSCAIQTLSARDGQIKQEVALVAGTVSENADRHDQRAIEGLGAELGIDLTDKTAAELLRTPLLIHNSLLPNGVSDLVRMYDQHAGGTFYGQAVPQQDYQEYAAVCRARQSDLSPTIQAVVDAILERRQILSSPEEAIRLLHDEAQHRIVDLALVDDTIDARVLGKEAADFIATGRQYLLAGDLEGFNQARQGAQQSARTASCPMALRFYGSVSAAEQGDQTDQEDGDIGEIHQAVCRTTGCPSRPGMTRVGGCDVCLHYCQPLWNKGIDPSKVYGQRQEQAAKRISAVIMTEAA